MSQRQPTPFRPSTNQTVQVIPQSPVSERTIYLAEEAKMIQDQSTVSPGRSMRRLFFVWLRIYVNERRRGKSEKVNVAIPLPIPIIGATFARQLSFQRAAKLAAQARRGEDVSEELESTMGLEFVRVEDDHPERDKRTLVVIGLD